MKKMTVKKLLKSYQIVIGLFILLTFVLVAVFAPLLAPHDPVEINMAVRFIAPFEMLEHPLGTDNLGRDTLSRLIYGARVSLTIGFASTVSGVIVGVMIGLVSGYYGGKIDTVIMRITDVFLAFPGMLLALVIVAILGASTTNVIIAVAIFAVPGFARIVRGSVLDTKKLEFVDAVKALGASDLRVMFRHILPNVTTPIIIQATLYVASAIVTASALSFLGVGTQPPTPEWGSMLDTGREFMARAPHMITLPGLMILLVVIGINLIGDGLRDNLEPKK